MHVVNLERAFATIPEPWKPTIAGEINDFAVKLAKLKGQFVWHHHDDEDELFLVVKGTLRMRLRDGDVVVRPGEFLIVPHGVEHCPVADDEVHCVLIERTATLNTGNVRNARTVERPERL